MGSVLGGSFFRVAVFDLQYFGTGITFVFCYLHFLLPSFIVTFIFCYLRFLLPSFLEAVLEAARHNTNVVLYLNRSPLIISYGFYFYDSFNVPTKPSSSILSNVQTSP